MKISKALVRWGALVGILLDFQVGYLNAQVPPAPPPVTSPVPPLPPATLTPNSIESGKTAELVTQADRYLGMGNSDNTYGKWDQGYYPGVDVKDDDFNKGVSLLKEAIAEGNGAADFRMGQICKRNGDQEEPYDKNKKINLETALAYFEEGASRNDVNCLMEMGKYYDLDEEAFGILPNHHDLEKAKGFYTKAVDLRSEFAKNRLVEINEELEKDNERLEESKKEQAEILKNDHFYKPNIQKYNSKKIFSSNHFTQYDQWVLKDFMETHKKQYFIYSQAMIDYKNNTGKTLIDYYFKLPDARGGDKPTKDEFLVEFINIKRDFFDAWKKNENPVVRSGPFKRTKKEQTVICEQTKELFKAGKPNELIENLAGALFGALIDAQNADGFDLMTKN